MISFLTDLLSSNILTERFVSRVTLVIDRLGDALDAISLGTAEETIT